MRPASHILLSSAAGVALALAIAAWLSLFGDEGRCWAVGVLIIATATLMQRRT